MKKKCTSILSVFMIVLISGCKSAPKIELSTVELNKINSIVAGLVEADIAFPFASPKEIPIIFYPKYLSICYFDDTLKLDEKMQANINYEQISSAICADWNISDADVSRIANKSANIPITIQRGLQGKQYTIESVTVHGNDAAVSVSLDRWLDVLNNSAEAEKFYTHKIVYHFVIANDDIKLSSATSE